MGIGLSIGVDSSGLLMLDNVSGCNEREKMHYSPISSPRPHCTHISSRPLPGLLIHAIPVA
jgi:hypothetical protein